MLDIRIVLVEPSGALNVGSIARIMKNMGLSQLWLVNPQFDFESDRYAKAAQDMAVRAQDILNSAKIVGDLPQALIGCHRAIATTGRTEIVGETPEAGLRWLLGIDSTNSELDSQSNIQSGAIVFGREDRGLTNAELAYCQKIVQIPISEDYPSINLAQAVAICCYQLRILLLLSNQFTSQLNRTNIRPNSELACIDHLEAYYQDLEAVLLKIGYLFPHTAFPRMQKFRHLFNKANLTKTEIDMLRGIIRQINWAFDN
jgi:tRNA/rRNA methyltransferase